MILNRSVRQTDRVIRYGGEEFMVVLPGAGKPKAAVVAEKIRQAIQEHEFTLPDGAKARPVTASLGVASLPEDSEEFAQAVKAADALLYRAKREGKNKVYSSLTKQELPDVPTAS